MNRYSCLLVPILLSVGCAVQTPSSDTTATGLATPIPAAPAGPACLAAVVNDLGKAWPDHHAVNIVAFGHSVPAGFGVTPAVHKRDAYPRQLEDALADAFPHAVLNVITAAVGGENSQQGRERFQRDVLDHHPRVVLIDYALNDRGISLQESAHNLAMFISASRAAGACPVLLTPTWDAQSGSGPTDAPLQAQASMIRRLGELTGTPVADSLAAFESHAGDRGALMAQFNHPNRAGHSLVVSRLLPLFDPAQAQKL